MNFNYDGNLSSAVVLHDQAVNANNCEHFAKVSLSIKTKLLLFDSMVVPRLLYGSEVWDMYYTDVD